MKNICEKQRSRNTEAFITDLMKLKLNAKDFLSNERIIKKASKFIDKISKATDSHGLISVIERNIRKLILVLRTTDDIYEMYSWNIHEEIEKKIDFIEHEFERNSKVFEFVNSEMNNRRSIYGASMSNRFALIISSIVCESLDGYNTNIESGKDLIKFLSEGDNVSGRLDDIVNSHKIAATAPAIAMLNEEAKTTKFVNRKVRDLVQKYEDISVIIPTELTRTRESKVVVAEIVEVREFNNVRCYRLKYLDYNKYQSSVEYGTAVSKVFSDKNALPFKKYGSSFRHEHTGWNDGVNLLRSSDIPYNFIDTGRLILLYDPERRGSTYLISSDPKYDKNYLENFTNDAILLGKEEALNQYDPSNISITSKTLQVNNKEYQLSSIYCRNYMSNTNSRSGMPKIMHPIKSMLDEYNYLIKKNKAVGKNVSITTNIHYDHNQGKVSYNDFSISIDDEAIKAGMFTLFNKYVIDFFRSESSEQEILDDIIKAIFRLLYKRLNSVQKDEFIIPMQLNNAININITSKVSERKTPDGRTKSKSSLLYLNDRRFNKNEIITLLKEMVCYRNNDEAQKFMTNIGRLGLSVYIGITTGYEINIANRYADKPINRIFKFKKLKGRSKYELILDKVTIPITGKKLITILYENFIGERVPRFHDKINKIIYESSESSLEYIMYKTLIDSSYDAFKEKSREFLDKKINDLGATKVRYRSKSRRQTLDAIHIKGASEKEYVVSYNNKDSFVYMSPELDPETGSYINGKYICMVDESNIKSNISYDTIISKLMALKNDSSIAHTIYNLEEEL